MPNATVTSGLYAEGRQQAKHARAAGVVLLVLLPVVFAIGMSVVPMVTLGLGLFVVALIGGAGEPVGGPLVAAFYLSSSGASADSD